MATTRSALTEEDIRTLVKGATADERALAARKLCRAIDAVPALTDEDRKSAAEILRIMAADAAELVRRALAETLRSSPHVPRDVALKLARDVESVALPMLHYSPVFTDDDLAEIVRRGGPVRQLAIAQRPMLARKVTAALSDRGSERAVAAACANDNADFAEESLQRVIARFDTSERVLSAIAYRRVLPLSVSERLISLVSEQVRLHLTNHHTMAPEIALQIAMGTAERATVDLVDQAGRAADIRAFVAHLNHGKRLSASLLLRGLAHGHMTFFEWGVAELAGVPHHRTWLMIHDAGPLGLPARRWRGCSRRSAPRWTPSIPWNSMAASATSSASRNACCSGSSPSRRPPPAKMSTTCSTRWTRSRARRARTPRPPNAPRVRSQTNATEHPRLCYIG